MQRGEFLLFAPKREAQKRRLSNSVSALSVMKLSKLMVILAKDPLRSSHVFPKDRWR